MISFHQPLQLSESGVVFQRTAAEAGVYTGGWMSCRSLSIITACSERDKRKGKEGRIP